MLRTQILKLKPFKIKWCFLRCHVTQNTADALVCLLLACLLKTKCILHKRHPCNVPINSLPSTNLEGKKSHSMYFSCLVLFLCFRASPPVEPPDHLCMGERNTLLSKPMLRVFYQEKERTRQRKVMQKSSCQNTQQLLLFSLSHLNFMKKKCGFCCPSLAILNTLLPKAS